MPLRFKTFFRPTLLLCTVLPSVFWGDTLVQQGGPFTWQNSDGEQISVTVSVHSNVDGYPGLYVWDYKIQNISLNNTSVRAAASGVTRFAINFPDPMGDLANLSGPQNWDIWADPEGVTETDWLITESQGDSGGYLWSIQTGQTAHVRFTTLPRQVLDVSGCPHDNSAPCAAADVAFDFNNLPPITPLSSPVRGPYESSGADARAGGQGASASRSKKLANYVGLGLSFYAFTGEVLLPGDPACDPEAVSGANAAPRTLFRPLSALGSNSISIVNPNDGQTFPLTDADVTATTLSFLANASSGSSSPQAVSWTAALTYQPSQGSFGPYNDNRRFSSTSGSPVTSTYTGLGGQLKVTAKAQTCPSSQPATATVTITGSPVPIPDIQNYLLSIYQSDPNMATPTLLVQIAEDESRWLQFCTVGSTCQLKSQQAIYGSNGPWPVEGKLVMPEDGSDPTLHIGLMQVPLTQDTAWNWVKNAGAGQQTFDNKFAYVRNAVKKIRGNRPGLRDLTPYEYENMALLQYGESPGRKYGNFYYVAACDGVPTNYQSKQTPTCNGQWDWQTTSQNTKGVKYVDRVRNMQ